LKVPAGLCQLSRVENEGDKRYVTFDQESVIMYSIRIPAMRIWGSFRVYNGAGAEDHAMDVKIGKVTHYYDRIGVAVLQLSGELKVGDKILILGRTTDFTQIVDSMEINHQKVQSVGAGAEVALKVAEPAHENDVVYRVVESA
jgi:hypothetical protein